jgi:4-amino-4-deoxy-L-arabinose transferase-like glycosyltransferase
MPTAADRSKGSAELPFGFALFFVALLPRLYVATRFAAEPVWDGHYYDFGARRIAAGFGYSDDVSINGVLEWHPWCHYPVGYSAFLGALYRVFGPDLRVAAIGDAITGALLAVVTWLLAKQALSSARAKVAGALVALHPGLILYAALVMTEPLASLLTLVAFWLAARDRERPWRGLVVGGLALGVAALVRPQALLCAPFLALVVMKPWRKLALLGRAWRIGAVVVACAVALVPVLPWTARNCARMDGCALVSTNAGWNLAIGAFPRATGRFETLRSSDGCREVTGQVQQDRCWLHYGIDQIEQHPVHWLKLLPAKLGFTFDHESFAVEYLHEARPSAWPEARRVSGRELMTLAHRVLLCAAALGAVAFVTRGRGRTTQAILVLCVVGLVALAINASSPTFWPLAIFACVVPWLPLPGSPPRPPALALALALLVTTAFAHAVFFGEDRYHVVATPVLCVLAAAAFRAPQKKERGTLEAAALSS